jgi:hypothetical protein
MVKKVHRKGQTSYEARMKAAAVQRGPARSSPESCGPLCAQVRSATRAEPLEAVGLHVSASPVARQNGLLSVAEADNARAVPEKCRKKGLRSRKKGLAIGCPGCKVWSAHFQNH